MAPNDSVVIDLSNYKDKVGSRVPEARYRVIVEDGELDKARSGNQMINLWFRILDGEYEGSTIIDRLVLTENSLFRVVGFMQAIGMPTPKKRLSVNVRQFIGKVLYIDVADGDPYMGRVKSEVRGYVKDDQAHAAKSDLDDLDLSGDSVSYAPQDSTAQDAAEEADATTGPVPDEIDLEKIDL